VYIFYPDQTQSHHIQEVYSTNIMPGTVAEAPKDPIGYADADGQVRRKPSTFRSWISKEPGAEFPPEKGRYV